ncbi:hypothetical protein [Celeribacter halophilus]|uniref:Uncharacterized protein n=1 Tax=Celeribacter halophilus TaxID=576117 RepID=A0A1I3WZP3_9RHOB|nr:hypothetical protein [Celeribacter halophilus]PZX04487.1 hypothetical protein LX82_03678 [Celeribacter halophilus]SFK12377.1 hypothetical protein SAMN04488138_1346 [Celeribacter halophilus]
MRLNLKNGPEWYDLIPGAGVRVLAEPATTAIMDAAKEDPRLATLAEDVASEVDDLEGTAIDPASATKLSRVLSLVIAEQVIVDWEGVEDAKGGKAPVTAEYIAAFLEHPAAADAWLIKYLNKFLTVQAEVAEEKKDSARSQTGTTGAARNTAKRAPRSAKTARAKKTTRKA